jgi:hypothetical protein
MDYLVKIRSVQTPLNGQFSIGANNKSAYVLSSERACRPVTIQMSSMVNG